MTLCDIKLEQYETQEECKTIFEVVKTRMTAYIS